jgi:hypothetical protein
VDVLGRPCPGCGTAYGEHTLASLAGCIEALFDEPELADDGEQDLFAELAEMLDRPTLGSLPRRETSRPLQVVRAPYETVTGPVVEALFGKDRFK